MNFSYGVIAAVGVLVAVSLGFVMASPDEVVGQRVADFVLIPELEPMDFLPMAGEGEEKEAEESEEPTTLHVAMGEGTSVPGCEADNSCFVPHDPAVGVGTTVVWSNDDNAAHTVSSGGPTEGMSGLFDSGLMAPGGTFEYTFEEPGEYDYFCLVHPWMVGVVTVS